MLYKHATSIWHTGTVGKQQVYDGQQGQHNLGMGKILLECLSDSFSEAIFDPRWELQLQVPIVCSRLVKLFSKELQGSSLDNQNSTIIKTD